MDEYANNLINLQNKIDIVATEDILSDNGMLLAKSGIKINKEVSDKILKFKLLKPLEESVALQNQLNAKVIYGHINQLIIQDPSLDALNKAIGDKTILQRCCLVLDRYPAILQKLTLLHIELQNIYEQGLFSAFLASLCAIKTPALNNHIENYFLAGIVRDIGFLHINYSILKKEGDLTPEEWRSIQAHPIIANKILKNINNFPNEVSLAVLEHHEKVDGSGYPRNKTGQELSELGQVLNVLDNVIAIYQKRIKQKNSLRAIVPILQTNMHSYFTSAVSVIIHILKYAPENFVTIEQTKNLNELIENTKKQQHYISKTTPIIKKTNKTVGYNHNNSSIFAIQNIGNNIVLIVNSAGLCDINFINPSDNTNVEDQKVAYAETEEAQFMLEEVMYQTATYQKNAQLFTSKHPDSPFSQNITEGLTELQQVELPAVASGSFRR